MPEFEDNSILGDSIYQHINFEGREGGHGPVDMKMFEQDDYLHSDENGTVLGLIRNGFTFSQLQTHNLDVDPWKMGWRKWNQLPPSTSMVMTRFMAESRCTTAFQEVSRTNQC